MQADGSEKEQLTDDLYSNWFPHPSPDGRYFVFLSYFEDQGDKHPAMQRVALRLYDLSDNSIKTLCQFIGGQGTINVPSWSPDGESFAFVSYQYSDSSTLYTENIYTLIDGTMPASAYINGQIEGVGKDKLVVLDPNDKTSQPICELGVSNAVRQWPNSADLKKIGDKKYILIAEQDGQAEKDAKTLQEIEKARWLHLLDVSDENCPKLIDSLSFEHVPTCVAFHPHQNLFALTFTGSNQIVLGTVEKNRLKVISRTTIELPNQQTGAIPHFTWHPDGKFAAISLAGNDRLVFLKLTSSDQPKFNVWGNILKTAPLPGVGYFTHNGRFFVLTSINLTPDLEQSAYSKNTSLLSIYRFDADELPNSPPSRSDDGKIQYRSPKIKHTKTMQMPFGQGYVESFAIHPNDEYIVGLNMKASWLPENIEGKTETSALELFQLDAVNGEATFIKSFSFEATLPEYVQFDFTGSKIVTASFGHSSKPNQSGSIDIWNIFSENDEVLIVPSQKYILGRGVHYFLLD